LYKYHKFGKGLNLSDIARAKITEVSTAKPSVSVTFPDKTLSIRVAPNSYLTVLMLGMFFAALLIYLEKDFWAVLLLVFCLLAVPALAWTDRIFFDGRRLRRTGILPRFWAWASGYHYRLKLSDVEQVETQALRAMKRGGNVVYRYRTTISGRDLKFVFASGADDYRQLVRGLFPLLPENVLDNRSLELRDYLSEPKEILMKAEFAHIPAVEVLEDSIEAFQKKDKTIGGRREMGDGDLERADEMRRLGNELRLSGFLLQALEAFRRALVIQPGDAWLLFETARCLHSYASAERDDALERRALALLRLAEKRANDDTELLARLGETYFQFGDWRRAQSVFQKSIDRLEETFRSVRGLAEIALREGKIAHVIHHFSTANRLAETTSLRRWSQGEADYFTHLNDDDDYMEMEISRINLLETLENSKKTCLRLALFGFPAILVGLVLDDRLIADIGWAVSTVSLLVWTGITIGLGLFADRIPYELIETDE
jgi:tetratricopeptide (TPR) repeat protein